jgi:hypothetical protein
MILAAREPLRIEPGAIPVTLRHSLFERGVCDVFHDRSEE